MSLQKNTAKEIKIPAKTIVGQVQATNAVPKMLTPVRNSLVGIKTEWVDEESLFKDIDLYGIQDWSKEDQ